MPATKPPTADSAGTPATATGTPPADSADAQAARAAGTPPGAAAGAARPGTPPPFATVIREARRIEGALTLWQREDKLWIELVPADFERLFLLSPKIKSGIGEAFVLGGLMGLPINGAGGAQAVQFQRLHNQVRLVSRNTGVRARSGTPEARAVAISFSDSLLGAVPVASQPHPEHKSILIEANGLFLSDLMGVGMMLQRGLRQGYGLDRGNSAITAVRGSPQSVVIETQNHFFTGNVGGPPPGAPGAAPALPFQPSSLPRFLPDTRSMLISLSYSLAPLPSEPMTARRADPRVGLFTTSVLDFETELQRSPRQRYVNRWRLEKKDPAAALSEPVRPITFWIDRNVPLAYRETVRAAILEWNKAFERIGFRGAIAVQQQPDDAEWDTLDFGYASVRWMMSAAPVFGAIGPSHVDPRSGEILDADIGFEGLSTRNMRSLRSQILTRPAWGAATQAAAETPGDAPIAFATPFSLPGTEHPADHRDCLHGDLAAEQFAYALDVLEARGDLEPDSPITEQFVLDYVKDVIMHEVGHALGLRHNFRASRIYTEAQLADPEFTRAYGTTGSVMEYNAINLPRPGERGGMLFQTTLGPYDFWAVEYAYKPMPVGSRPEDEAAELLRIAGRSHEPQLAFGTDEDSALGLDPETLQLDLGADPLAFAEKRLAIARDLFRRQESRPLPPDRDYTVLRRSIGFALGDATRAVGVLTRQIGGLVTLRDFPGSGRDPLTPVPAAQQRQALTLITHQVLSPEGLSLSPALQRRLAPDFLERGEPVGGFGAGGTDFPVAQRLLDLQRAALGFLLSDGLASRILDNVRKFDRPQDAFQLDEVHVQLQQALWADLPRSTAIAPDRRELQRDHANRLATAVLRPSPQARVDARSRLRAQTRQLLQQVDLRLRNRMALDSATAAHLEDVADTLRQALAAPLLRQAL